MPDHTQRPAAAPRPTEPADHPDNPDQFWELLRVLAAEHVRATAQMNEVPPDEAWTVRTESREIIHLMRQVILESNYAQELLAKLVGSTVVALVDQAVKISDTDTDPELGTVTTDAPDGNAAAAAQVIETVADACAAADHLDASTERSDMFHVSALGVNRLRQILYSMAVTHLRLTLPEGTSKSAALTAAGDLRDFWIVDAKHRRRSGSSPTAEHP